MDDDEVTVITADYMYLIIISTYDQLLEIANVLNNDDKKHLILDIDQPCANINLRDITTIFSSDDVGGSDDSSDGASKETDTLSESIKTFRQIDPYSYIRFREGVECAQTLTFAEGYNRDLNILFQIDRDDDDFYIGLPRLNLEEEIEPEKMITNWIKSNNLSRIMNKVSIKPINIVGNENEILVFAAKVENIKN